MATGRAHWRRVCDQCHGRHLGLAVCVDAQIWRLATLAGCLGRVAAGCRLVALFCGSRWRLGGLVSPLYFVSPNDRGAVCHTDGWHDPGGVQARLFRHFVVWCFMDPGGVVPWSTLNRFSLGRRWLCAPAKYLVRLCPLDRRLWHGSHRCVGGHERAGCCVESHGGKNQGLAHAGDGVVVSVGGHPHRPSKFRR